jgi:hypothetical protein
MNIRNLKKPTLKEGLNIINLLGGVFFAYGFVCSDSLLFKLLGGSYIIFALFVFIYNFIE